jgi:hypothetical protein
MERSSALQEIGRQASLPRGWAGSAWEEFRGEKVDEYRELDGERVLVFHSWSGRGKASGLELGQMQAKAATLFQVRGGKVSSLGIYFDPERAVADLGLGPSTGHRE